MARQRAAGGRPRVISDDDLLDVARALFLERGAEATTSEIAKRARISESVIFYRYRTKDEFIRALLDRELVVPEAVRGLAGKAGAGEIAEHLFDAAMALIEVSRRVGPLMAIATAQAATAGAHHRYAAHHPVRREISHALARYFEAEIEQRRLRAMPPEVLVCMFLGAITQLVSEPRTEARRAGGDVPAFVRALVDALLKGARPGSASKRK